MLSFIFFCTLSTISKIEEMFSCCRSRLPRLPMIRFFCSAESYSSETPSILHSSPTTAGSKSLRRTSFGSVSRRRTRLPDPSTTDTSSSSASHLPSLHLPVSAAAASSAAPNTADMQRFAPVHIRSTDDNTLRSHATDSLRRASRCPALIAAETQCAPLRSACSETLDCSCSLIAGEASRSLREAEESKGDMDTSNTSSWIAALCSFFRRRQFLAISRFFARRR